MSEVEIKSVVETLRSFKIVLKIPEGFEAINATYDDLDEETGELRLILDLSPTEKID